MHHMGAWEWAILAAFVGVYAWGAIENRDELIEIFAKIVRNRRRVLKYTFFTVVWLYLVWRDEVTTLLVTALFTWALWPAIRARWFTPIPENLPDDEELGRSMRELLREYQPHNGEK
jgi:hypothetical protein